MRLKDAEVSVDDWNYLMKQTPTKVRLDISSFVTINTLHPRIAIMLQSCVIAI